MELLRRYDRRKGGNTKHDLRAAAEDAEKSEERNEEGSLNAFYLDNLHVRRLIDELEDTRARLSPPTTTGGLCKVFATVLDMRQRAQCDRNVNCPSCDLRHMAADTRHII